VSDYAFDGGTIPPELQQAMMLTTWGAGDVFSLPAGLLPKMNASLNIYRAVKGYLSNSGKTVEWTKRNPDQWNLVSALLAERKRGNDGNSTK
jgi:hypothetical protein